MDTKCPQRGNRSGGNVLEYMRMMLAGNTLEQIGAEYGVTHGAVRKALQAAGLPTNSRKLLAAVPEGGTPTDAAVLRAANHALAQENHELKARLRAIRTAVDGLPPNAAGNRLARQGQSELTGLLGPGSEAR